VGPDDVLHHAAVERVARGRKEEVVQRRAVNATAPEIETPRTETIHAHCFSTID
jgi:hypothetical protein